MRPSLPLLVVLAGLAVLGACGDGTSERATVPGAPGAEVLEGTITVFAAASLTDAFGEVAGAFESANPGTSVELSFAGSSSLREQILAGAPADVLASADGSTMAAVIDAGDVEASEVFATNRLQVVVPAGNPAGVTGLEDLARSELLIGLCAAQVPCGDLGRQALDAAGVTPSPDTDEPDVRALLTKVSAGELDAGLVYVTDVVAAGGRVEGIDLPERVDVVAAYPIGTLTSSANPALASAFVDFVLGADGRAVLARHGFGLP